MDADFAVLPRATTKRAARQLAGNRGARQGSSSESLFPTPRPSQREGRAHPLVIVGFTLTVGAASEQIEGSGAYRERRLCQTMSAVRRPPRALDPGWYLISRRSRACETDRDHPERLRPKRQAQRKRSKQRLSAPCEPPTSRNVERETGPHLTGMHRRVSPGAFADRRAALFSGSQTHARSSTTDQPSSTLVPLPEQKQACRLASVEKWIPSESPEGIFFWNTREHPLAGGPRRRAGSRAPPSDQGMSAVFAYCLDPRLTLTPVRAALSNE